MDDHKNLAFPIEEYDRRLTAVRERMQERDLDALIVTAIENLGYLTGYAPSATMLQACVIPLSGEATMVVRELDALSFTEVSWVSRHRLYDDTRDAVWELADEIKGLGFAASRIGIETDSHYLTVKQYQQLCQYLGDAELVDFSDMLWELRLRKSVREIAKMREAAFIADKAMDCALAVVREGTSEREAAKAAASAFIAYGADDAHVGPIAAGKRTDSLHGHLTDYRLEKGDTIHIELVPSVSGYSARLMRPAAIGRPTSTQLEEANRLIEIQDRQLAAMKPGALANEIDRILREQILEQGLRSAYPNITGYTLGYYGKPLPPRASDFTRVFLPTSDWELEPDMIFHMYALGPRIAFSETVLITDQGHERLTTSQRRLFET